nr:MAG TPA: hypothetical protein [Caudoviricetes sp.]
MENKKYSEQIEELRFLSNKISDILDFNNFDSLERRRLRDAQDILDNRVYVMEEFKNEEEYWS